jgi:hypothetical protein
MKFFEIWKGKFVAVCNVTACGDSTSSTFWYIRRIMDVSVYLSPTLLYLPPETELLEPFK